MHEARTLGLTAAMGILLSCGGTTNKPIVQPNPEWANCSADKTIVENECLKNNPTREGFDACIAEKRKTCVDGGTP